MGIHKTEVSRGQVRFPDCGQDTSIMSPYTWPPGRVILKGFIPSSGTHMVHRNTCEQNTQKKINQ